MSPADFVAILNAINVPWCITVLVAGGVIMSIKSAVQRGRDAERKAKHGWTSESSGPPLWRSGKD